MTESTHHRVELFPAIDLRGGRCVRLEQGAADRETVYHTDPLRVAEEFAIRGADWVHVVDLDAAFGEGSNRKRIVELAAACAVRVQTGGGLRSESDLQEVLDGPVARAVIGTAALEQPELVRRALRRWGPERIVVGLDARGRRPAVRGWREDASEDLFGIAARLRDLGVEIFVYTDIARDGMFSGPNLEISGQLADHTGADVIVSGGVGTLADLDAVRDSRCAHPGIVGVIVGKAIYEGRIAVEDALQRLQGR